MTFLLITKFIIISKNSELNNFSPSSTSAETNMINPEQTYCGTVYASTNLKLRSTPMKTIISDANKICLQRD